MGSGTTSGFRPSSSRKSLMRSQFSASGRWLMSFRLVSRMSTSVFPVHKPADVVNCDRGCRRRPDPCAARTRFLRRDIFGTFLLFCRPRQAGIPNLDFGMQIHSRGEQRPATGWPVPPPSMTRAGPPNSAWKSRLHSLRGRHFRQLGDPLPVVMFRPRVEMGNERWQSRILVGAFNSSARHPSAGRGLPALTFPPYKNRPAVADQPHSWDALTNSTGFKSQPRVSIAAASFCSAGAGSRIRTSSPGEIFRTISPINPCGRPPSCPPIGLMMGQAEPGAA